MIDRAFETERIQSKIMTILGFPFYRYWVLIALTPSFPLQLKKTFLSSVWAFSCRCAGKDWTWCVFQEFSVLKKILQFHIYFWAISDLFHLRQDSFDSQANKAFRNFTAFYIYKPRPFVGGQRGYQAKKNNILDAKRTMLKWGCKESLSISHQVWCA